MPVPVVLLQCPTWARRGQFCEMMAGMRRPDCPVPTSMKRFGEVHRFWHRALDNYADPEEYLPDLNAAIQAARNTTFALQKEKAQVPDFDEWYKRWQDALRSDPVMKWLHDARTRIVHSGDLEARSVTTVRLEFNYQDAAREIASDLGAEAPAPPQNEESTQASFAAPALVKPQDIAEYLRSNYVPEALVQESTVSYERRWEDDGLPGRELSGALAHGYAALGRLLAGAHTQANATCDHDYGCEDALPFGPVTTSVRPPSCMATTRHLRTRTVELHTGLPPEPGVSTAVKFDPQQYDRAQRRYVGEDGRPIPIDFMKANTVLDLIPAQIEHAKAILRSGEDHGWFIIFYRGGIPVGNRMLAAANAQQKRELAKEVAEVALKLDANGVLEVGEIWMSPSSEVDGQFTRPADHPERREAVSLHAMLISGKEVQVIIPFTRPEGLGGPVEFGEVEILDEVINNFMAPLRAAWDWKKRFHPAERGASFFRNAKG